MGSNSTEGRLRTTNGRRAALVVAIAWVPSFAFCWLFLIAYSHRTPGAAALVALYVIGSAALLAVGAWWLTGRLAWPDRVRPGFFAAHLVAAVLFAGLWVFAFHLGDAWRARIGLGAALHASGGVLLWDLLAGTWIYGAAAGVSYAIRNRRRAEAQESLAARAQALAIESQLLALRAQVNPHFLFNALHTVGALVRLDPARAQRAVEQLGDMLRYALGEGGFELVALRAEWRFTETYLALEQARFGPRLRIEADLAPAALDALVPPLSLQTLVENAVRHGIAPVPEGGAVEVRAWIEADRAVVRVRSRRVESLPHSVGAERRPHGLALLAERLQALYGTDDALGIEPDVGGAFVAWLRIPQARARKLGDSGRH